MPRRSRVDRRSILFTEVDPHVALLLGMTPCLTRHCEALAVAISIPSLRGVAVAIFRCSLPLHRGRSPRRSAPRDDGWLLHPLGLAILATLHLLGADVANSDIAISVLIHSNCDNPILQVSVLWCSVANIGLSCAIYCS